MCLDLDLELELDRPSLANVVHNDKDDNFHDQPDDVVDLCQRCLHLVKRLRKCHDTGDPGWTALTDSDAMAMALMAEEALPVDADLVAATPDLVAAVFQGKANAVDATFNRVCRCFKLAFGKDPLVKLEVRARLVETVCNRYSAQDDFVVQLWQVLVQNQVNLSQEILLLSDQSKEAVIKTLLKASKLSNQALSLVLTKEVACKCLAVFQSIALSTWCRINDVAEALCCHLAKDLPGEDLISILLKALQVWGDPIIARAYVTKEVIHVTQLVLLLFYHARPSDVTTNESKIIESLVKGLPNHFNSSDGRTVELAKYLSEIITESLKVFANGSHKPPEDLRRPPSQLCSELLQCIHECDRSKEFWLKPCKEVIPVVNLKQDKTDAPKVQIDSDDSSSDLEPIEALEPPTESKIKYIRNFLELLPEMKERDDVAAAFDALPNIVRHQLKHEHVSVGNQLIDVAFFWENEFEDPQLDRGRKASLVSVVSTRPCDYARPLCLLFHRDQVQPYRKNLILQVLEESSKALNLKDLQLMVETVFDSLVLHEGSVAEQDVVVRIPMILFMGQMIRSLPPELVKEDMLLSFLGSVRGLGQVDAATEQTICYALSGVMSSLGDAKISPRVREGVSEARNWILAMQMQR